MWVNLIHRTWTEFIRLGGCVRSVPAPHACLTGPGTVNFEFSLSSPRLMDQGRQFVSLWRGIFCRETNIGKISQDNYGKVETCILTIVVDVKYFLCIQIGSQMCVSGCGLVYLYKGRIHNRKTAANPSQDCVLLFHAQRNNLHIFMHFQCWICPLLKSIF